MHRFTTLPPSICPLYVDLNKYINHRLERDEVAVWCPLYPGPPGRMPVVDMVVCANTVTSPGTAVSDVTGDDDCACHSSIDIS